MYFNIEITMYMQLIKLVMLNGTFFLISNNFFKASPLHLMFEFIKMLVLFLLIMYLKFLIKTNSTKKPCYEPRKESQHS